MCDAGRALCTGTGSGFDPRHQGGEGVAGTPGACSQAFCHPIGCMLVMVYRQRSSIYTQVRTTTTTNNNNNNNHSNSNSNSNSGCVLSWLLVLVSHGLAMGVFLKGAL